MAVWQDLVAIVVAYLIGCIATAYYIVRLRTGQAIRQLGSGNVGGRNAGRVLGRAGFAIVAVGDALKGLLAWPTPNRNSRRHSPARPQQNRR